MICALISLGLTACKESENNTPEQPADFNIVGTWKYENSGISETGTRTVSETIVFNQDGTFSWTTVDVFEARKDDPYAQSYHVENIFEGTYTAINSGVEVSVETASSYDESQGKMVANSDFRPYEGRFLFDIVGNAIVMQSEGLGGWLYYAKDGAKPQFNYANHELVGTWVYSAPDPDYSSDKEYIHEEIYTFNADGSMEYYNYQYRDPDTQEIVSGSYRSGYWAIINNSVTEGMEVTGNAKTFTTIDTKESWWNTDDKAYTRYGIRNGGHPMQYELKDGKLYIGHIGMDDEYFYQIPLTKK